MNFSLNEKDFECPVCFSTIDGEIYRCGNGLHLHCKGCASKMKNCGICREFTFGRDRWLENMVSCYKTKECSKCNAKTFEWSNHDCSILDTKTESIILLPANQDNDEDDDDNTYEEELIRNKWGKYMEPETRFVFANETTVCGIQDMDTGEINSLTTEQIYICVMVNGWIYDPTSIPA